MFDKILIANRGEIALRVLRACKELGIATVAVHSTADEDAMHVRLADESVCIGPPPAKDSYLNIPALLAACEITGADAVHPGYGFLSENARFAEILGEHNVHFIGPRAEHIRLMGDKIAAKRAARQLGIPVVPGSDGGIGSDEEARVLARDIGFPVMLKASAGGGGRGIRVAADEAEFEHHFHTAQAEATAAFGSGALYLERFLNRARHIEVQVMGDGERVLHFFERECSLQRRRQKIWEEAPSPALDEETRQALCASAVRLAERVAYRCAGTLEYLYDDATGEFFFIEMNTRIQVEHPITEMITGVDLVREMILIAQGEKLKRTQSDVTARGAAIEVRINAEDPDKNFRPSPGKVIALTLPGGPGVRVDTMLYPGYTVPPYYDSLLAKIVVHAETRQDALARLRRALDEFSIEGVVTTAALHKRLAETADVQAGRFDTGFLERLLAV
jgi:acetyl-CoA carboxylase, biotin carboxylase subunit